AGSYMGTDNRVQLVDTIGVGMETGLFFGTTGIGPEVFANAQTKAHYIRTFSHLKPLTSIKAALNEPFRNILVPALRHEWASLIDPNLLHNPGGDGEGEWKNKLKEMVGLLKENLQNGESLIITDNLGSAANIRAGYRFTERISVQ